MFRSRESSVFRYESVWYELLKRCDNDNVMYEMNYESLFGWDRNLIYEYTFFLKLSSLPLFLCDVCFVSKYTMIVFYTWARDLISSETT